MALKWLRQSTATTLLLGPFVDDNDGKTPETALTISQADVRLWKEGGTTLAQKNDATSATHREDGYYTCPINATDTNTLGVLVVKVNETGALPYKDTYAVVPAVVYDAIVLGTDNLDVQVTGMGAGVITAAAVATGAIDADALATDAVTEIRGDGSWATAIPWNVSWDAEVQSEVTDALNAYDPPTNAEMEARTLAAASYATAAALAVVDGIVDNIIIDTAELQGDWANGGRLDLILDARASQVTADAIETDTQNIQSRLPTTLNNGFMRSSVDAGLGNAWQEGGVGNKNIGPAT